VLLSLVPILVGLCRRIDACASVYCGGLQVQFVKEFYSGSGSGSGLGQPCGEYNVRKLRLPSGCGRHTEGYGGNVPAPPLYGSSSIKMTLDQRYRLRRVALMWRWWTAPRSSTWRRATFYDASIPSESHFYPRTDGLKCMMTRLCGNLSLRTAYRQLEVRFQCKYSSYSSRSI
jgi:hypothetical protein